LIKIEEEDQLQQGKTLLNVSHMLPTFWIAT